MASLTTANLAQQSFIFDKESGKLFSQSNTALKHKFREYNNEVYERHIVHRYEIGKESDVEWFAQSAVEWRETEKGQWVLKNGLDVAVAVMPNYMTFTNQIVITAYVTPKRWTEFCLRFS